MQILHIDSSILTDASVSRALSAAIVNEIRRTQADAKVIYRDVVADAIPHLDGPIAACFRPIHSDTTNPSIAGEHARSQTLVTELLASDVVVIGVPMYNFSVASQLKSWIDRVVQPGRTFHYTDKGPVGLATGKRVFVASTRGGLYSSGPAMAMDFQEDYLTAVFSFIGITDLRFVRAENLSRGTEAKELSMHTAHETVAEVVSRATSN